MNKKKSNASQQNTDSYSHENMPNRMPVESPKLNIEDANASSTTSNNINTPSKEPIHIKDWIMISATVAIAIATIIYTFYSREQWKIMAASIENVRLDQRAWLGPTQIRGVKYPDQSKQVYIKEGQPFMPPEISLTNSGKTPALNVRTAIRMGWLRSGVLPDFPQAGAEKTLQSTMHVMQPNAISYLSPAPFDKVPSKADINNLKSGQNYICIIGMITYEDIFRRPHVTKFCMQLDPDLMRISACPTYNEAD